MADDPIEPPKWANDLSKWLVSDSQKELGETVAALRRQQESWRRMVDTLRFQPIELAGFHAKSIEWTRTANVIGNAIKELAAQFQPINLKGFFGSFEWIVEEGRKARLVEKSGWLPHKTTPFDLLTEGELSEEEISTIISGYYTEQWEAVEATFLEELAEYDVDDEAKATVEEALKAHRLGLFRVAPRLLFPEIERVCSDAFFEGKRYIFVKNYNEKEVKLPITRLKEVWEMVREMPLGDLVAYEYSWQLFKTVEGHLYDEVGDDEEVREKYRVNPVPNRHAALHGIIRYATQQTSINAIIMAHFIFHLISQLKKYEADPEDD